MPHDPESRRPNWPTAEELDEIYSWGKGWVEDLELHALNDPPEFNWLSTRRAGIAASTIKLESLLNPTGLRSDEVGENAPIPARFPMSHDEYDGYFRFRMKFYQLLKDWELHENLIGYHQDPVRCSIPSHAFRTDPETRRLLNAFLDMIEPSRRYHPPTAESPDIPPGPPPLSPEVVAGPEPPAAPPEPTVILGGQGDEPIVLGKRKPRLTKSQYNVVTTLLGAGDDGLSKDSLANESKSGDAVGVLKRLAKSDADWKAVIKLAGKSGGRYRIG